MTEEMKKVLNNHKQVLNDPWTLVIILLFLKNNKDLTNVKELDRLLTITEKGDIDLLKEELGINEQSIRNIENDKKS